MVRRIDHIAIAVRDLNKARAFFLEGLGGRELFSAPMSHQKFRWTTIELGTSCLIELVDPLGNDGFLHRFLETRGEGPHHITIQVHDIHETRRMLEEKGIPAFGFSESLPGWKEIFIHPRDAFGTLIQFAEFDPLDWVNPGYIPTAYREFAPPQQMGSGEEPVEVRRLETADSPEVEILQGQQAIRISRKNLRGLIQALEKLEKPPSRMDQATDKKTDA